ncbi:MAG: hypothetical protein ACLR8P_08690 [Clostridium fessum]
MGERNFHLHGNSFNRRAIGTEYETLACEYLAPARLSDSLPEFPLSLN